MPTLTANGTRVPSSTRDSLVGAPGVSANRPSGSPRLDAEQFELFDVAPHAKPLLTAAEAARSLDCSTDQVVALVDCGRLHAVSISDRDSAQHGAGRPRREHVRITRLSVAQLRANQPTPGAADYAGSPHWCLPTSKQVIRVDELATAWRISTNQVRALLPEMLRFSISDNSGTRQHWRIPTASARQFIDARLAARNFSPAQT